MQLITLKTNWQKPQEYIISQQFESFIFGCHASLETFFMCIMQARPITMITGYMQCIQHCFFACICTDMTKKILMIFTLLTVVYWWQCSTCGRANCALISRC